MMDAKGDLSLRWMHMSEGTFSDVMAQPNFYEGLKEQSDQGLHCLPFH